MCIWYIFWEYGTLGLFNILFWNWYMQLTLTLTIWCNILTIFFTKVCNSMLYQLVKENDTHVILNGKYVALNGYNNSMLHVSVQSELYFASSCNLANILLKVYQISCCIFLLDRGTMKVVYLTMWRGSKCSGFLSFYFNKIYLPHTHVFVYNLYISATDLIQCWRLGDNIFGSSTNDAAESLFKAFGPAMDSRLPWAAVLGNHDQESTMTREELMSFISLMDYSLSQPNPSTQDPSDPTKQQVRTDIDGFGNYDLRVLGPPGSHLANQSILNLFFLDSGDRAVVDGFRTYGWIKESQLNWLRGASKVYFG